MLDVVASARRSLVQPLGTESTLLAMEQLARFCRDDNGPLMSVLREAQLRLTIQSLENPACRIDIVMEPNASLPTVSSDYSGSVAQADSTTVDSADVIFAPTGGAFATLHAWSPRTDHALLRELARPLLSAARRSLSERWFRVCFRRHWIVAAQLHDRFDSYLLLAVDRDKYIVGADHAARTTFVLAHLQVPARVPLSAYFKVSDKPLRLQESQDVLTRLSGATDKRLWTVLLTPPHPNDVGNHPAEATEYARPRMYSIAGLERARLESPEWCRLPSRSWREIEEFIEAHLEKPLTVDDMASRVGLSASHFSRVFSATLKMPPHSYLMSRRLHKAQELLATSNMPLAQIALVTGFSDQSHLSRRFRDRVGRSPSSFRRQHR
jgi:AraC-like DNA-binding protein